MYPLDARSHMNRARFFAAAAAAKAGRPAPVAAEVMPRPTPMPIAPRPWRGRFRPSRQLTTPTIGALADDLDLLALTTPATAPVIAPATANPYHVEASAPASSGGWFSDLLSNIVRPAATAYAQIAATSTLAQYQQRAAAQTWNPALTGPAIQAQGWQAAYNSGSGAAPLGLSGTTLAVLAGGGLFLWAITRKK